MSPINKNASDFNFDVARARHDTPACENVLHFNNAGAALMPAPVVEAVQSHWQLEAQIGGYEAEAQAEDKIERTYDALAALLHCDRDEIALMESATRAWDMAFYSLAFAPGDRVLIGAAEYASSYIALLQMARKTGVEIHVIPDEAQGQISLDALRAALDDRVKLIALTHVPTNSGLVNPAEEVGAMARAAGVPYLLDACQSAGQIPLDVNALNCDFLAATGRKYLRGPRGTGFLYVRRAMLERVEPIFLDLQSATLTGPEQYVMRADARRFETWETSFASRIGLGAAVDYALAWGVEAIEARVIWLAERLRARLRALPGVTVWDRGARQCGLVTFTKADESPDAVKTRLAAHAIHVWISRQNMLWLQPALPAPVVRASLHYYNTEEEIDRFCAILTGAEGL